MKMDVVKSFDRGTLVRRTVARSEEGVIYFRSQKLDRDTLTVTDIISAFRPESIPVFVGLYLVHFHGSATVKI